jgi:hypothetical protein
MKTLVTLLLRALQIHARSTSQDFITEQAIPFEPRSATAPFLERRRHRNESNVGPVTGTTIALRSLWPSPNPAESSADDRAWDGSDAAAVVAAPRTKHEDDREDRRKDDHRTDRAFLGAAADHAAEHRSRERRFSDVVSFPTEKTDQRSANGRTQHRGNCSRTTGAAPSLHWAPRAPP